MKSSAQITALMYHRIDAVYTDPWGICVVPQRFDEQIRYFTDHYPVISVPQAMQQLATGGVKEHSICITFDDGYGDNYVHAKPILEQYHCPATFFIPAAFIGATVPFWWDELEYIFLHIPQLPQQLSWMVNGHTFHYTLNDNCLTQSQWQQHQNWKWYDEPPTDRCSAFLAVWEHLRPLPQPAIQQHLAALRAWAGSPALADFRMPMNNQQLQTLFANTLFTAGLHTHTHPDLATKSKEVQQQEIEQGKMILEKQCNLRSTCLAYPYGRYNETTLEVVKALQLTACFTTEATAIDAASNKAALGRYQVGNWSVNELKSHLAL